MIVKRLLKNRWLIGVGVLALILLIIGITVPVLAATGNSDTNSYGNSYLDGPTMARLAGVLGMTPADLNSQLTSGKTLAALAQEHNVTEEVLIDAMVAPYADQLATQVKYSYLTQDQADSLLSNAKSRAGSLLQQDLSGNTGNGNQADADNDGFTGCYDYMTSHGYAPGSGWGGFMGPGMMYGWGSNYNNSGTPPNSYADSNNNTDNSNVSPGGFQNRGFGGWGMGGGMMGGW
jgi:hypothetical protein